MPLRFRKVLVSDERFEAAGVFDVNNDGVPDIVSGAYWYEGPDFRKKHFLGPVKAEGEYFDDFSVLPLDVNGDGYLDTVTGGWWGDSLWWRENPGAKGGEWTTHLIAAGIGNVETTRAWDVDGDGQVEIVPNTPGRPLVVYKLVTDAAGKGTGEFAAHTLWAGPQPHGFGFGDITGNGRGDFVLANGWLEAPADPFAGEWRFHQDFEIRGASIPMLVVDVNGDGLNDIIVGQGHNYGLEWLEQRREGGRISWVRHPIDPYNSQYHDLHWVDLDGDGACELVTGKRYRAHNGNDPGEWDANGIYYFKWNGESFSKQVIDYGPIGEAAGCGIQFALADLRSTGRLDLVAPGKDGLHVFHNEG